MTWDPGRVWCGPPSLSDTLDILGETDNGGEGGGGTTGKRLREIGE